MLTISKIKAPLDTCGHVWSHSPCPTITSQLPQSTTLSMAAADEDKWLISHQEPRAREHEVSGPMWSHCELEGQGFPHQRKFWMDNYQGWSMSRRASRNRLEEQEWTHRWLLFITAKPMSAGAQDMMNKLAGGAHSRLSANVCTMCEAIWLSTRYKAPHGPVGTHDNRLK